MFEISTDTVVMDFYGSPRDLSGLLGQECHLPFFRQPADDRQEGRWIVGALAFAALTVYGVSALHIEGRNGRVVLRDEEQSSDHRVLLLKARVLQTGVRGPPRASVGVTKKVVLLSTLEWV